MLKHSRAFTLVELLVVIAVIGILASITVVGFTRFQVDARDAQRSSKTSIIAEALEKYYDTNGEYPSCSAVTLDTQTVSDTVLPGIGIHTLSVPSSVSKDTNSIKCTNLNSPTADDDHYAYIGDGSAACATGQSCLEFTLKYRVEGTGEVISINSRHKINLAGVGAPVLSISAPSYTQVNLSWTAVQNASGYTLQYATNSAFTAGLVSQSSASTSLPLTGLTTGTTYYFRVQAVSSASTGSWSNVVSKTINFSTITWTSRTGAGSRSWNAVTMSDDGTKLAAVAGTSIYTSTNAGASWTTRTPDATINWRDVASSADGTKLVAVGDVSSGPSSLFTSTDSGVTWIKRSQLTHPEIWMAVASSADGNKLLATTTNTSAGSSYGRIYWSTNSGVNWTRATATASISSSDWSNPFISNDGAKMASLTSSGIAASVNGGSTWAMRGAGSPGMGFATSADMVKMIAGGGYPGYMISTSNSGSSWSSLTSAGSSSWTHFASSADGTKLVAGGIPSYIATSIDGGANWVTHTSLGQAYRSDIQSSVDGTKIVISPSSGYILTGTYNP